MAKYIKQQNVRMKKSSLRRRAVSPGLVSGPRRYSINFEPMLACIYLWFGMWYIYDVALICGHSPVPPFVIRAGESRSDGGEELTKGARRVEKQRNRETEEDGGGKGGERESKYKKSSS